LTFTRGKRLSFYLAASVFFIPAIANCQQPVPGALPEGKPTTEVTPTASQAAASSTRPGNATSNKPKDDSGEETSVANVVRFGPGDLIEVSVYNVPELATKARISNAGDIYLPLIDYVHVAGLTQEEAQSLIEKRLGDGGFVRNPHVTIYVDEASSQGVTIMGEVARPGIYPAIADHKLYTVISEAGGFSATASRKIAIVRHNQAAPIRIDLPRNLTDDLSGNVDIVPGDTINVPRAPIVYVVGDVGRPAGFAVDNGQLTVLQALALAGGTNKTAKLGGARIIHKGPNGVTETKIEIKKMLEAKSADVVLQADDILFVPVSGAKVAAGRTVDLATSAALALTVYSVHP
jgi:polysaccharide export outer membrane protein